MKAELLTITPELAAQLLTINTNNRPPNKSIVTFYANQMAAGLWKENTGEAIKVSKSGVLLDGQQRLMAVVKSGVTIKMLIISDLDDSVFDVLDTGKPRGAADVFELSSIKSANRVASIIRRYKLYKAGYLTEGASGSNKTHTSNAILLSEYHLRSEFWQYACNLSGRLYDAFSGVLNASEIGFLYAIFYDISPEQAEPFLNQLATGEGIQNNSILLVRNLLIKNKLSIRSVPTSIARAWIIKAWNAFRNGNVLKNIRFSPEAESYPVPK